MLSKQDNSLLVTSEANTVMGNYLRCYWHPLANNTNIENCRYRRQKSLSLDNLLAIFVLFLLNYAFLFFGILLSAELTQLGVVQILGSLKVQILLLEFP